MIQTINESKVLLEAMTQSVLITTPELSLPGPYITYVNKAFEEMTGWSRDEILGKNPRILQGPKTDRNIFYNLRSIIAKGEVWKGKTINYKKDGSEFYMEWSITPVFNKEGEIVQLLAVQDDITENVKIEERLEKSRRREQKRIAEIEKANLKLQALSERQNKILNLFSKYVPQSVVEKALDDKNTKFKKGIKLNAALMFCDLRRFTAIAEKMSPSEVVQILNTYYSKMTEVIKMHNGVINQFTGDEIFAAFGAPDPIHEPEISVLNCAVDMIKKLDEINEELKDLLPEKLKVGIGINYGAIVAGNLGSDDRLTYAITGDAVNTCKRIESLTSEHPNSILMNETVYFKTKDLVNTKLWGNLEIKGKKEKVKVYQVV